MTVVFLMIRNFALLIALLGISVVLTGSKTLAADQTHADIVLVNGSIYTMDAERRWAQALAISNGQIIFVGTDQEAVKYAGALTNVINLRGKMVMPGFIDSHVHPVQGALEEEGCYISDFEKEESMLNAIGEYAKAHAADPWIVGSGWALPIFGVNGPTKEILDKVVPDKPAYIVSQDGHSAWVNSLALEKAGITAFSPDPKNGRIERSSDGRTPSGTLREGAMELVSKLLPVVTDEQKRAAALAVQKKFNALGIVAVQDASVDESILKAYAGLDDSNLLTMRVSACMTLDASKGEKQIEHFKELRKLYDGDLLSARSVKIFADGVVEAKTAAMLEPYLKGPGGQDSSTTDAKSASIPSSSTSSSTVSGSAAGSQSTSPIVIRPETVVATATGTKSKSTSAATEIIDSGAGTNENGSDSETNKDLGILNYPPTQLKWYATKIDAAGFQIHIHAIGDRAIRTALDSIQVAQKINGRSDKRHHIAHLEIIHPDDIKRFRMLNVTANFQPFWAFRDKYMSELTEPFLGPQRSSQLYPIASLFRSGAPVAAGSDWTVTTANPLDAIQVAVTRCGLTETADKVFLPEERVSLPEILSAYTINGAYLGHWDKLMGSLEPGKEADLIVLDKNLFEINPSDIHNTKVLWTLFKGREVYRDPNFQQP